MTCTECRERMVEALYAELDDAQARAFRTHIDACSECRAAFGSLRRTLGVMDRYTRPEPDAAFWQRLDESLRAAAAHPAPRRFLWRPAAVPVWAYGAAAILLVAAGIYLGRTWFRVQAPVQEQPAAAAAPAVVADSAETAALAYLGRTKNLLLDLVNAGEAHETAIDLERRQRISRQLLEQSDVITASLNKPDQQLLRQLLGDLEIILTELANTEVRPGVPAVELVRRGVDQKSILLKINLEEMRAAARRTPPDKHKPTI